MNGIGKGTPIGPYVVTGSLKEAGEGGMAYVFVAKRNGDGEKSPPVALKVAKIADKGTTEERITQQQIFDDALSNEVETLSRLHHPRIVRLYPVQAEYRKNLYIAKAKGILGDPWYCAMEYLAGGSLADLLDNSHGSRRDLKAAVEIIYQVGQALEYLHKQGIAHLDIKPDNVLFRQPFADGELPDVALIDFGIARRTNQRPIEAGAASYMSLELIELVKGDRPRVQDLRPADVYSLGVLLYRAISGKLPYQKRDKTTTIQVIAKEESVPITKVVSDLQPSIVNIIHRALERDAGKRPSISEFLGALNESVPPPRWSLVQSQPMGPKPVPSKRPRFSCLGMLLGGLAGLALGILLASMVVMVFVPGLATQFTADVTPMPPTATLRVPLTATIVQTTVQPTRAQPTVTALPTFTPAPPSPIFTATPQR